MRAFTLSALALALASLSLAQGANVTSISYSNGATIYLTQTDSNGVVTGQPSPVTTQPAQPGLITTQPNAASVYALSSGLNTVVIGNRTLTYNVANNSTSLVTPTPTTQSTTAGSGSSGSGSSSSRTGASASSTSSGAADHIKMASGALAGAGAVFALFL